MSKDNPFSRDTSKVIQETAGVKETPERFKDTWDDDSYFGSTIPRREPVARPRFSGSSTTSRYDATWGRQTAGRFDAVRIPERKAFHGFEAGEVLVVDIPCDGRRLYIINKNKRISSFHYKDIENYIDKIILEEGVSKYPSVKTKLECFSYMIVEAQLSSLGSDIEGLKIVSADEEV